MRQKLSLITLGVKSLPRALEFYRDGLGWKPAQASQADVVFFSMGGIILSLYPREALADDAAVSSEGGGFEGITLAHNVRSENEVDEVLKTAERAGARIVKPAQKVFWGGYSGYFADPDGHLWEVAHNPFVPFDEHDNLVMD